MTLLTFSQNFTTAISTHTLTWSVTDINTTVTTAGNISTHTLTWSVTQPGEVANAWTANFNSHAHVERDFLTLLNMYKKSNFNSHAHVERDFVSLIKLSDLSNFNSHAHVERDFFLCRFFLSFCHFNSHAHVERDVQLLLKIMSI